MTMRSLFIKERGCQIIDSSIPVMTFPSTQHALGTPGVPVSILLFERNVTMDALVATSNWFCCLPLWTFHCIYGSMICTKSSIKLILANLSSFVKHLQRLHWLLMPQVNGNDPMLHCSINPAASPLTRCKHVSSIGVTGDGASSKWLFPFFLLLNTSPPPVQKRESKMRLCIAHFRRLCPIFKCIHIVPFIEAQIGHEAHCTRIVRFSSFQNVLVNHFITFSYVFPTKWTRTFYLLFCLATNCALTAFTD